MKRIAYTLSLLLILFSALSTPLAARADTSDELQPEETFSSFFARITRGGAFPGIRLQAPERVQKAFLTRIRRSFWVGERDQVYRNLKSQGVDLWGDWYQTEIPQTLLVPTQESHDIMVQALGDVLKEDHAQCDPHCPAVESFFSTPWAKLSAFSHQTFAKAYVYRARLHGGKTILEHLGEIYGFPAQEVASGVQIRLLSHDDFVRAVRTIGWDGPVYFRGITAPDPANKDHRIILLDDEKLAEGSPFDAPLLRFLEISGILTHETSHVFQDFLGRSIGLDVQVTSPESALVIEGMAEHMAETALRRAGDSLPYPSALSLFAVEQGVEIVYRPGNDTTGNLFPYTVGLPFAASIYDLNAGHESVATQGFLEVLGGKTTLSSFLSQLSALTFIN